MPSVLPSSDAGGSAWRRQFADALIRMRPDMNPDAADEISDSAFHVLGEFDPACAAARYCRDCMRIPLDGDCVPTCPSTLDRHTSPHDKTRAVRIAPDWLVP